MRRRWVTVRLFQLIPRTNKNLVICKKQFQIKNTVSSGFAKYSYFEKKKI